MFEVGDRVSLKVEVRDLEREPDWRRDDEPTCSLAVGKSGTVDRTLDDGAAYDVIFYPSYGLETVRVKLSHEQIRPEWTPLHQAIRDGDAAAIDTALDGGWGIEDIDRSEQTPLM